jgi:hypothetical protein
MLVFQSKSVLCFGDEDAHDLTQQIEIFRSTKAFMLSARGAICRNPERPICVLVEEQAAGMTAYWYRVCLTSESPFKTTNTSRVVTCYMTSVMR